MKKIFLIFTFLVFGLSVLSSCVKQNQGVGRLPETGNTTSYREREVAVLREELNKAWESFLNEGKKFLERMQRR